MVPMDRVDKASIFSAGPATLSCLRLSSYTSTDSSKSRGALMKLTFTGRVAMDEEVEKATICGSAIDRKK